jgi:CBS-domain-containing membrane protein
MAMLVKEFMTKGVVWCTPWDTAQAVAELMKVHDVGAIPVVWDMKDPLVEGIVTDRDLCCGVVAEARNSEAITISELMTPVPVTCQPEFTMEECEELMQQNQVRRIPVVDERGRCIGIVTQADIALHAPETQVAKTIQEISKPAKKDKGMAIKKDYLDEQTHEQDQILLLNRRRELHRKAEVCR